jgi:hypothetical protein
MQARLILSGHGVPPNMHDFGHVPQNGQMIRMIPGTCPPIHAISAINGSLLRNPNQSTDAILSTLNSVDTTQTNAFRLYEPTTQYSDQYIQVQCSSFTMNGEDGMLNEYAYNAAIGACSLVNKTKLLTPTPQSDGNMYVKLSEVHALLRSIYPSYLLIVVSCVSTGHVPLDENIQKKVKKGKFERAMKKLTRYGFAGGKKGSASNHMNQKTIRKKRQNCKKKLSTKKTRKSHRK